MVIEAFAQFLIYPCFFYIMLIACYCPYLSTATSSAIETLKERHKQEIEQEMYSASYHSCEASLASYSKHPENLEYANAEKISEHDANGRDLIAETAHENIDTNLHQTKMIKEIAVDGCHRELQLGITSVNRDETDKGTGCPEKETSLRHEASISEDIAMNDTEDVSQPELELGSGGALKSDRSDEVAVCPDIETSLHHGAIISEDIAMNDTEDVSQPELELGSGGALKSDRSDEVAVCPDIETSLHHEAIISEDIAMNDTEDASQPEIELGCGRALKNDRSDEVAVCPDIETSLHHETSMSEDVAKNIAEDASQPGIERGNAAFNSDKVQVTDCSASELATIVDKMHVENTEENEKIVDEGNRVDAFKLRSNDHIKVQNFDGET